MKYCKLSDYAKKFGVTYRTAFNRYCAGLLEGSIRDATGHICVPIEYLNGPISNDVVIYASVSNNKPDEMKKLDEQVDILTKFCNARGYHIDKIVREISSSVDGERPKFVELLKDRNAKHIVIEKPARVSRFGYELLETVLETDQRQIEAMNDFEDDKKELLMDSVKYIYSICKKLGTKRLPKKNIKKLLEELVLSNEAVDSIENFD